MPLSSNIRLGRYEIRSPLGAGGMGEVYLARDAELERTVALKILPAEVAQDWRRMQRFVQEAKTVSALNHPNILTIYEFGQADALRFIATEYVDGLNLRQHMKAKRMKLHEALDIAMQVAAALDAAHEAGVVHRDIKPENIMVRRRDQIVKVLDFGLAKLTEKSVAPAEQETIDTEAGTKVIINTEPGVVLGTVSYMSPEQSRGSSDVDERTDIWSLGVVLYEMVTGRLPFEGTDIHRQVIAIQEQDPPPLSRYMEGVPERLEEIVEKALAKDPSERYQTAKDLLIDLRNLKRKLEIEAEIDRTIPPEVRSAAESGRLSNAQSTAALSQQSATIEQGAHPTTSAEYIVGKLKRHKLVVVVAGILALAVIAAVVASFYFVRGSKTIDSVAVLPFVNSNADPNTEWLSDGITESLINSLSKLPGLRVIARSTVFRYKGAQTDPLKAGRDLGVTAVLTGRVLQRGDTLSIQVDLVNVSDGTQIWGEQYNRRASDLLAIQQDISREISERLRMKLSGDEEKQLSKGYTENTEAYRLYLQGQYHLNKRTRDGFEKATDYYQQAIAKDANYALAYSGLSVAYALTADYMVAPAKEMMPKAKDAALKAIALDNNLAEGHVALGQILRDYDYNFADAEREYKRAIELNPNYAPAHQLYGELLNVMGRHDEALAEVKRALELDPLSLIINRIYGEIMLDARRYDESIAQLKKAIELDPNFPSTHLILAQVYEAKGMYPEAVAEYSKQVELIRDPKAAQALRDSFAREGWKGFARKQLELLKERAKTDYVAPSGFAIAYARLGEKDEAMAWLEKAYEEHDYRIVLLKVRAFFDPLRDDPRFQDLIRRVGFP